MTMQPTDSPWWFTDTQIVAMLNEGWAQSEHGRHALAADAFRRVGQACETKGLDALARRAWAALDAELTLGKVAANA